MFSFMKERYKMDLTLKTSEGLFNHRVAAVIVCDNKILAQKNTDTNEYYLPGGRVAFGETSENAVIREILEELKVTVNDYRPLWINECFFVDNGKKFHEIGIYYLVSLYGTGFNNYEPVFQTYEGKRVNTYEWLDIDNLNDVLLYPLFLKTEIKNIDKPLKLIITDELNKSTKIF